MIKFFLVKHQRDILLTFIFSFFLLCFYEVFVAKYEQKVFSQNKIDAENRISDLVFNQLDRYYLEAENNATFYARKIERELLFAYNYKTDVLIKDLSDLKNGRVKSVKAILVIYKCIDGVSLNNVPQNVKDNNDLIVFLADLIIGDLSKNCATNADTRTIKDEAFGTKDRKPQFVPLLGENAMNEITLYGKNRTFWHFLDSTIYVSDIKSLTDPSLNDLKMSFVKNELDLEFLKGYEFLAVSRIKDDSDISGAPVLDPNGHRRENLQLHIVQGFNLIDQIDKDADFKILLHKQYESLNSLKKEEMTKEFEFNIQVLFFAVILSFLCIFVLKQSEKY